MQVASEIPSWLTLLNMFEIFFSSVITKFTLLSKNYQLHWSENMHIYSYSCGVPRKYFCCSSITGTSSGKCTCYFKCCLAQVRHWMDVRVSHQFSTSFCLNSRLIETTWPKLGIGWMREFYISFPQVST